MRENSTKVVEKQSRSVASKAEAGARRVDNGSTREEEFLKAALDLFAERNFASVTIKDIAQSLGVNTALIYYYFENKNDLFRATIEFSVERAFDSVRALEGRTADPPSLISAWLDNHVKKFAEIHRFVKIALDFKGAHEGHPEIEASIERFYAQERKFLSRVVREGVERRLFKPVDPDLTAQFISVYLDGCMVRSVILPDFDLAQAVVELRRVTFDLLGYRKKTPRIRKRR